MTLVVRDEVDIVDAQIEYHLNAGVDFVLATDHDSRDGTTDILEKYVRDGYLRLFRKPRRNAGKRLANAHGTTRGGSSTGRIGLSTPMATNFGCRGGAR